jgi:hypothetical protein
MTGSMQTNPLSFSVHSRISPNFSSKFNSRCQVQGINTLSVQVFGILTVPSPENRLLFSSGLIISWPSVSVSLTLCFSSGATL